MIAEPTGTDGRPIICNSTRGTGFGSVINWKSGANGMPV
jgi:hypothetical protein